MADNIKLAFTYAIALLLIVGGLMFLYLTRLDDPATSNTATLIPLVSAYIGAAVAFVFQQETQTRTARQVERSIAAGAASLPNVIANAGPPNTITVTPAVPPNTTVTPPDDI